MKKAMAVLQPALTKSGSRPKSLGHVVIGTIEGDIHDIGKTLVATMLSANGFEITDLGADVPAGRFVDEAEAKGAGCIAISALLTTTMPEMRKIILSLVKAGIRDRIKIMIGGAPVNQKFAQDVGADGYGPDAASAVDLARALMSSH
jgi:5-methyltetrahydrofolate--homocysteine methyltransferase